MDNEIIELQDHIKCLQNQLAEAQEVEAYLREEIDRLKWDISMSEWSTGNTPYQLNPE